MNKFKKISALKTVWIFNLILALYYLSTFYGLQFIKSSVLEYSNISSDPFDGTVYPISYVPNWLKSKNTDKSLNFGDEKFAISDFVEIPKYDINLLQDSSGKNPISIMVRYEYPVVYMGSYRLNYEEYNGSHPGVDIRAPIGTPVLSIANGVVTKVKNTESGDGKYVVIRHDNVNVSGNIETLYSGYEHLSQIVAIEGTKIKKGDVLGYIGMTGITTTPHLHFQIDKDRAPFHAYWPYTFKEASNAGLDFFSAVNVGLGKENAMEYTINPMDFINNNLSQAQVLNSAPDLNSQINVTTNEIPKILSVNPDILRTNPENISTSTEINSGVQKEIGSPDLTSLDKPLDISDTSPMEFTGPELVSGQIFYDISLISKYYKATKYLYDSGITKGYSDGNFGTDNSISRGEALIFIFKTFNIKLDSKTEISFKDIKPDSFLTPYLKKAIDLGYIAKNKYFRQDDKVTRAEFITMLIKASGKKLVDNGAQIFPDVKGSDWFAPYINTFASLFPSSSDLNFQPNSVFNRGQIALILFSITKNK